MNVRPTPVLIPALLVAVMSIGAFAFAATDIGMSTTADRLKLAGLQGLRKIQTSPALRDLKFSGGHPMTIDDVITQAHSVNFVNLPEFHKSAGALRKSAFYEPETRTVYVNAADSIADEALQPLSMHEIFGALGINDDNYQISLAVMLMDEKVVEGSSLTADQVTPYALRAFLHERNRRYNTSVDDALLEARGGSSIVGGGGDDWQLLFKSRFLNHFKFTVPSAFVYYTQLLQARFDISFDESLTQILFQKVYDGPSEEQLEKKYGMYPELKNRMRQNFTYLRIVIPIRMADQTVKAVTLNDDPATMEILWFLRSAWQFAGLPGDEIHSCHLRDKTGRVFRTREILERDQKSEHPVAAKFKTKLGANAQSEIRACQRQLKVLRGHRE